MSDRHFKNIILRLVKRTQYTFMDERTALTADSTTPKAIPIATSNFNLIADASTSVQISISNASTSTPMLTKEKENKTLTEYTESTAINR